MFFAWILSFLSIPEIQYHFQYRRYLKYIYCLIKIVLCWLPWSGAGCRLEAGLITRRLEKYWVSLKGALMVSFRRWFNLFPKIFCFLLHHWHEILSWLWNDFGETTARHFISFSFHSLLNRAQFLSPLVLK